MTVRVEFGSRPARSQRPFLKNGSYRFVLNSSRPERLIKYRPCLGQGPGDAELRTEHLLRHAKLPAQVKDVDDLGVVVVTQPCSQPRGIASLRSTQALFPATDTRARYAESGCELRARAAQLLANT